MAPGGGGMTYRLRIAHVTETTGLPAAGHRWLPLLIAVAVGMTAGRSAAAQDPALHRTPTREPTPAIAASVRVGEPAEWTRTGVLVANPGGVRVVTFLGRRVMCAAIDGRIRVIDPATRRVMWTMDPGAGGLVGLVAAAGGSRFVTATRRAVTLWDAVTRRELRTFPASVKLAGGVAMSGDGRVVAFRVRGFVTTVCDVDRREQILALPETKGTAGGVAVSGDGARVAAGRAEHTVGVWDIATGDRRLVLAGHDGRVRAIAFTSDGARIVTAGEDAVIRVWDTATGRQAGVLVGHEGRVTSLSLARDDSRLLSRAADGTARVWDMVTGSAVRVHRMEWGVRSAALGPAGETVAFGVAGYDGGLWIGDAMSGDPYTPFDRQADHLRRLALSHDGRVLVSGIGSPAAEGAHVWSVTDESVAPPPPNGRFIAWLVSDSGRWGPDGSDGEPHQMSGRDRLGVAWPNRASATHFWGAVSAGETRMVYLVTEFGVVRVGAEAPSQEEWETLSRGVDDALQVRPAWRVAPSVGRSASPTRTVPSTAEGTMLARDENGALVIRDVASGKTLHRFRDVPDGAAALSGDGSTMAVASRGGTIEIWRQGSADGAATR